LYIKAFQIYFLKNHGSHIEKLASNSFQFCVFAMILYDHSLSNSFKLFFQKLIFFFSDGFNTKGLQSFVIILLVIFCFSHKIFLSIEK